MMATISKERMTKLLREAAEAHHEYEEKVGERDDDWPAWYAEYIVGKLDE